MFGILDYRAYKLFWLIMFPISLMAVALILGTTGVVALVVQTQVSTYHFLVRLVAAWFAAEIAANIIGILFTLLVHSTVKKAFFWVIDVVPAHGKTPEEARHIAEAGPSYELGKLVHFRIA
jgi:hypothetical protein